MGAGNDLHGGDYTKAAIRAVEDALHHSSLTFIRALGIDKDTLQVDVTIGVQKPDEVDTEKVKGPCRSGRFRSAPSKAVWTSRMRSSATSPLSLAPPSKSGSSDRNHPGGFRPPESDLTP